MTRIFERRAADAGPKVTPAERNREFAAAELDQIAAAGADPNGSLGGGNVRSAAEWPPPPRLA